MKAVREEIVTSIGPLPLKAVARNGVITLRGSVPASDQFGVAVAAAKGVEGVSDVENDLTVRPEGL